MAAESAVACGVFEGEAVKDEENAGCSDGSGGASLVRGMEATECGDSIAFSSICTKNKYGEIAGRKTQNGNLSKRAHVERRRG